MSFLVRVTRISHEEYEHRPWVEVSGSGPTTAYGYGPPEIREKDVETEIFMQRVDGLDIAALARHLNAEHKP